MVILYVLLGIIYILVGSEIGAVVVLGYLTKDECQVIDSMRSFKEGHVLDKDQVSRILGVGVALAIVVLFWPAYLVYLSLP